MSDKKVSKRKQAFEIFKENNGAIDLIEIARLLESPPGTVRGWKSKDKWDDKLSGTFQEEKRSVPKDKPERSDARGAPPGNQNGKGNKGGGAPPGNDNAVTTGEYETIFADYLSDDELDTFEIAVDPVEVITEEIKLLRVRQRRMLKRIKDAEAGLSEKETEHLFELRGRKKLVESNNNRRVSIKIPELEVTQKKEKSFRKLNDILAIEDALTRVSNQLQKAIKQLNELTVNVYRVELMQEQTRKVKAETTEIGGAATNDEVEDWKKAVIDAANKRASATVDDGNLAVNDDE